MELHQKVVHLKMESIVLKLLVIRSKLYMMTKNMLQKKTVISYTYVFSRKVIKNLLSVCRFK